VRWTGLELADQFAAMVAEHGSAPMLTDEMVQELTLEQAGDVSVVWAPFDHVTLSARLVVVGITPGRAQAENALSAFGDALRLGADVDQALLAADRTGSFSGPMRRNLVDMLDHIGVPAAVGVESTEQLFALDSGLLHTTSALRYPVFIASRNYNGSPDMVRTPILRRMIDNLLTSEAEVLASALWLPLGPKAERAVGYLVARGSLEEPQVLRGLPHPSGANAERIAYFLGRKPREALSPKTNPDGLDATRSRLMDRLSMP
jgi:hypothetical protein